MDVRRRRHNVCTDSGWVRAAISVAFSPDGRNLHVASSGRKGGADDRITGFSAETFVP